MQIKERKIGLNYDPLVIAEIGINHGGNLGIALKMVDAAHESGAEIIKHQTHVVNDEMTIHAKKVIPGNSEKSIYQIMDECALSEEDEIKLKNYVENKGMIFISTPFSRAAADRLHKMEVPAFKIGSGECNNYPLLEHICKFKKPIILSTGMNNLESIEKAVNIIKKNKIELAILHTTNVYPTPTSLVRLGALNDLQSKFPNTIFGLSDHTTSNLACFAAVALGASIVERHFTDNMNRNGPDIINSMDPKNLKELIFGVNEIAKMRGGSKHHVFEEEITMNFAFATVVAIKKICKGENLNIDNIWVKRPGIGEIKAEFFEGILGKKATRDIDIDDHLNWNDFE
jgi:N-acetylneuraminate synthase